MRPISPQSLNSSSISRSNTFNTISSGGTHKSREMSPDPKGYQSPRRVLSQKSHRTFDSSDKEQPSTLSTSSGTIISNASNKNDWMMISDVSCIV